MPFEMDHTSTSPTWHEYKEKDYTANAPSLNHPPKTHLCVGDCLA